MSHRCAARVTKFCGALGLACLTLHAGQTQAGWQSGGGSSGGASSGGESWGGAYASAGSHGGWGSYGGGLFSRWHVRRGPRVARIVGRLGVWRRLAREVGAGRPVAARAPEAGAAARAASFRTGTAARAAPTAAPAGRS